LVILAGLESVHAYGMEMLKTNFLGMVRAKKRDEKPVFQVSL